MTEDKKLQIVLAAIPALIGRGGLDEAEIAADERNEEVAEYYRGKEVAHDEISSLIISLQQEQPALPSVETAGIPGKDFIPTEWVDACERYGKWKIVKQEQPRKFIEINGIRYKEIPAKTDDKICKECDYFLDNGCCNFDDCPCTCADNILERIQQEHPEWNEEDERMRQTAIEACKTIAEKYELSADRFYKCKDWLEYRLKSLRIQPKQEWSEEEIDKVVVYLHEKDGGMLWCKAKEIALDICNLLRPQPQRRDTYYDIIHNILDTLKDIDFMQITPQHRVSLLNDIRVKCKNADECAAILDEPHWKPSEEQISALEYALGHGGIYNKGALESLFTELKKL